MTSNGARDSGRVRRWPYLLCRGTTAVLGLLSVTQAVLAGSFLGGHYDALQLHLTVAMVMVGVAVVQAAGVVVLSRPLAVLSVVGMLRLAAWVWRLRLPNRARDGAARSDMPVGALS